MRASSSLLTSVLGGIWAHLSSETNVDASAHGWRKERGKRMKLFRMLVNENGDYVFARIS